MRRRDFLWGMEAARVREYIAYLRDAHAFSGDELAAFFARIRPNPTVLRLMGVTAAGEARPAATAAAPTYWREYRRRRVAPRVVARGGRFYRRHEAALRRAQADYGAPAAVIVAILGIETDYGANTGNFGVARTLVTLAFGHPTRGEEFREELTEFLLYAREARLDPASVSGSFAGAIGMAQFMPSSIRRHAVDVDGDRRVDLFEVADAAASIGNFLRAHGWRRELEAISYPARMDEARAAALIAATAENEYRAVMTADDLAEWGVRSAAPARVGARYVFVDLPNRLETEYRVGTENFYALTRYNKSFKYAAAVTDLSREIRRRVAE